MKSKFFFFFFNHGKTQEARGAIFDTIFSVKEGTNRKINRWELEWIRTTFCCVQQDQRWMVIPKTEARTSYMSRISFQLIYAKLFIDRQTAHESWEVIAPFFRTYKNKVRALIADVSSENILLGIGGLGGSTTLNRTLRGESFVISQQSRLHYVS